uniref:Uncharacterized protein n=1 Tax=Rhizophora mucronata TaxID=61149 RepID=A0A2P2IX91_RHIMU
MVSFGAMMLPTELTFPSDWVRVCMVLVIRVQSFEMQYSIFLWPRLALLLEALCVLFIWQSMLGKISACPKYYKFLIAE